MNTAKIDTAFLRLHPATAAWWRRRPKCQQCANMKPEGSTAMRCSLARRERYVHGSPRGSLEYCIDARLEGAACGPSAKLFTPKGGAA